MVRLIASVLVAVGLLLGTVATAAAAEPSFGSPTATAAFGKEIVFRQPVTVDGPIAKAELLIPGAVVPSVALGARHAASSAATTSSER